MWQCKLPKHDEGNLSMFNIGDYAVCPGHGVGQITDIEEKNLGEATKSFYIIKILANGMTVMVPTDSENGVRKLVQKRRN